jgi:protein-S-isoprenylcysteine O-methyltransferase Ste14
MNAALLVLAIGSYGAFSWGAFRHFRRVEGVPAMLGALSLVWAATVATQVAALLPGRSLAPTAALALPLFAAALALWLWALRASGTRQLSLAFSRDAPLKLIESGPYRLMRHPFYTSYMINWLAGCVATWRWWTIAPSVLATIMLTLAARAEEGKFARSPLAGVYEAYRARTGMFLPALRRRNP